MKNVLLVLSISLLMSACTSMGRVDKGASLDSEKESIFIIGVSPENYRISAFGGKVKDGKFHQNMMPAAVYGAAENGYIVGKASKGQTLAITNVRVVKDESSILGADFVPCKDAKTMTFNVPAGKVVYLGDIEYEFSGTQLLVKNSKDLNAAKKYIDENYPKLRDRLEPWETQLLPTTASCTQTIYVPVYM